MLCNKPLEKEDYILCNNCFVEERLKSPKMVFSLFQNDKKIYYINLNLDNKICKAYLKTKNLKDYFYLNEVYNKILEPQISITHLVFKNKHMSINLINLVLSEDHVIQFEEYQPSSKTLIEMAFHL